MRRELQTVDPSPEAPPGRLPRWLTETPYWAISAVAHLVVLLVIGGIVITRESTPPPETKLIVRSELREKPFEPEAENSIADRPEILAELAKIPFVPTRVQIVEPKTPPKGLPDRPSDKDIRDSINDAIGTGGGGASLRGLRGDVRATFPLGGGHRQADAVRRALEWLKRHQHPDGHWSSHEVYLGNTADPAAYDGEIHGFEGFDVGVTGLAMLAFLGFGHTHHDGRYADYRKVVRKAMNWMLAQQIDDPADPAKDGCFGLTDREEWIYNHAIATMAMSELLFMSGDRFRLSRSVERATEYCFRAQNPGYGWKYDYRGGRSDTSVTGWMVLALKASKECSNARLITRVRPGDYRPHFDGALNWLDRVTGKSSSIAGYEGPGDEGSRLHKVHAEPYPFSKRLSCMTAVSVLCRLLGGQSKKSPAIENGVSILMREPPVWATAIGKRKSRINLYYWYYGSYALFQYGGPKWRAWNEAMMEALLPTQIIGTDKDGSWDPIGEWGPAGGRVYSTAIGAMTLEVYYRFRRLSP